MISLLKWLLIPITATAALSPAPPSVSHVPLLGEEAPYVQEYPVDHKNTLVSLVEPPGVPTDQIVVLLQQYFPENWKTMYEIAKHESTLNPIAYNPEDHDGVCKGSYGLLQVACVNYPGNPKDLFDPETNIRIARQVYDKQAYGAWGVCTKKIVQCGIM